MFISLLHLPNSCLQGLGQLLIHVMAKNIMDWPMFSNPEVNSVISNFAFVSLIFSSFSQVNNILQAFVFPFSNLILFLHHLSIFQFIFIFLFCVYLMIVLFVFTVEPDL